MEKVEGSGQDVKALEDKPEINPADRVYYTAFGMLSSSRQSGMSTNPFVLSEILVCAELLGMADVLEFVSIIQQLDSNVLEMHDGTTRSSTDSNSRPQQSKSGD